MSDLISASSAGLAVPPQASSDAGMIELWLKRYRSPHTRRGYTADAAAFMRFHGGSLHSVTVRDIQSFSSTLDALAPATASRRLSAVKSLIKLAHRIGYLPFDVGAVITMPAIADRLAERILTEPDVQRMLWMETKPRDAALLRLLYSAGLRIAEACAMRWRDFVARDIAGQITVMGKGGKTRNILLPEPIWTRLATLRGNSGPDAPVFRSRNGGALSVSQVHVIVKRAAKRAKLSPAVSAHWLRHAHVSHSLDRGAPVHVVRATVGHSSLETTSRYSHARPDDSSARYLTA